MAIRTSREFFTYGDHCWSLSLNAPLASTQDGKDSAGKIFRAIISELVKNGSRIIECLDYALELDGDSYTVHVVGTPVELSKLERTDSGYTVHISVFPALAARNDETNG